VWNEDKISKNYVLRIVKEEKKEGYKCNDQSIMKSARN
jgi:hypothetical protein